MKKIINKFKAYFIFIGIILISVLLLSLLNTLGISKGITNIISIIIRIITFLIMGISKGKNREWLLTRIKNWWCLTSYFNFIRFIYF